MRKYIWNQINQLNSFATLGNGDFTCLHQKQPESWEIFTLLKGRDDCSTLKFQPSCSSLVCWWRLWPHFIIHKNHFRENSTLVAMQQKSSPPTKQTLVCLFCSRHCSSTYIWTWHAWDFLVSASTMTVRSRTFWKRQWETAPPWTWNLRTQWDIWQLPDTFWEGWGSSCYVASWLITFLPYLLLPCSFLHALCPPTAYQAKPCCLGCLGVCLYSWPEWYTQTICSMKNRHSVIVGAKNKMRVPCKNTTDSDLIAEESEWRWAQPDTAAPT